MSRTCDHCGKPYGHDKIFPDIEIFRERVTVNLSRVEGIENIQDICSYRVVCGVGDSMKILHGCYEKMTLAFGRDVRYVKEEKKKVKILEPIANLEPT